MTDNAAAAATEPTEVTARQLAAAQAKVDRGPQNVAARDELVHRALAEGWTQRQVARAMGLTHGRVAQISQKGR